MVTGRAPRPNTVLERPSRVNRPSQPWLDGQQSIPKSPPGRPLRGLPDGSTPSPLASTASYKPSVQLGFNHGAPTFCWENLRGLRIVRTASSPPMGGHRRPLWGGPGGLGRAGLDAGQRGTQAPQGVLGVCVPAVVTGAQGWTGGTRGWPGRGWGPGGLWVGLAVDVCPPQNTLHQGQPWGIHTVRG